MHKMMTTVRTPVSIKSGGVTHHGYLEVDGGMVRVSYRGSTKATQIGGSPPGVLARLLLGEMVREAAEREATRRANHGGPHAS